MRGLSFRELMEGKILMSDEEKRFGFDFNVRGPGLILLFHWSGTMTGTVTIDGFVTNTPATGELETAPIRGWMRYMFTFQGPSGELLRFDGRKRIRFIFFGWTLLRGSISDESGRELGRAVLRFKYRRHFLPMLLSMRTTRITSPVRP